jgi:ribonuclease HI
MVLDIYTDARSGQARVIQIASIVVDDKDNEFHFVEKTSVGLIKNNWVDFKSVKFKANSTIAEMYSIMKTLKGLSFKFPEVKKVNIYTDSLSCYNFINRIGKGAPKQTGMEPLVPKCKLIKRINDSIIGLISELKSEGIEVNIMWVKGHDGCYFNEKVDTLCKAYTESGIRVVSSSHS